MIEIDPQGYMAIAVYLILAFVGSLALLIYRIAEWARIRRKIPRKRQ